MGNDETGKIDQGALLILRALEKEGFEAYIVGGSVRDLLLGKIPHDWDITTSARPDEVISCAEKNEWKIMNHGGYRFGTVVIAWNGNIYEVTTFRREFYGLASHKPQEIYFAETLKEDVSRRDFTVNAMAMDADGVIYDYFGGVSDLERRILRTVGVAEERFREDALRSFRACRFLGELDFVADQEIVRGGVPHFSERGSPFFITCEIRITNAFGVGASGPRIGCIGKDGFESIKLPCDCKSKEICSAYTSGIDAFGQFTAGKTVSSI